MDILENPLELCGFAFIEFVSKENELDPVFGNNRLFKSSQA